VFTDDLVGRSTGATAVQPNTGLELLEQISSPRSSTHYELVALGLGLTSEKEEL